MEYSSTALWSCHDASGRCAIETDRSSKRGYSGYFGALVVLLVGGLVLAGSWATYHAPGRNDQYQLIQLGHCVYNGGRMYADCWENKPPGIAWLGAMGFIAAKGNPMGPWISPGVIEVGVLLLMWASLRGILQERTGRKAVLLAALVYALRVYDTPSINPDFYSSMFELAAIALLVRGAVAPLSSIAACQGVGEGRAEQIGDRCTYSYWLCAAAGLSWGAATSMKQVGCVGLPVLTFCGIAASFPRRELRPHIFRALASTWAGFLLGVACVAGVLWHQGTLREAWHAIYAFNIGLVNGRDFMAALGNRARWRAELAPLVLPLWLALTGVIMSFWYRRFRGFPLSLAIGLVLWWLAAVMLAGMGPSRSMRYWQATFPPMLVLAAVGLYYLQQVQDRLAHPERLTAFVVAATVAILLARPAIYELRAGLATSIAASSDHPTERDQLVDIGDRLRGMVGENEPIYVLDYRPGIYIYADRPAAARFNYPRSAEQWNEILTRLETGQAQLVIVPEKPAPEFRDQGGTEYQTRLAGIMHKWEMVGSVQGYAIYSSPDVSSIRSNQE